MSGTASVCKGMFEDNNYCKPGPLRRLQLDGYSVFSVFKKTFSAGTRDEAAMKAKKMEAACQVRIKNVIVVGPNNDTLTLICSIS